MIERRGRLPVAILEVLLLAGIALAVRLAHIHAITPWYDDFYHLLAARSWLADGSLSIADGEYTRAAAYTRLVAASIAAFGDSVAAGRIPAVLAGTLWVVAVFAWTRQVAGRVAAWGAGLLFALDPGAIHLSQWVRFYTLHGLLVWLGAIGVYYLLSRPMRLPRAAMVALASLVAFYLGVGLLRSTWIALAGTALWASGALLPRLRAHQTDDQKARWTVTGGMLAILALGVWVVASGTAESLWASYTSPFFWQEGTDVNRRWYAWWLSGRYPTLFTLFPVAFVLAAGRFPRPALFCLVMFVTAAIGVSFAAGQAERYLYFGLPFFFVLWGLALATLLPALRVSAERALGAMTIPKLPPRVGRFAVMAFTVLAVAFMVSQNDASRMSIRMVLPGEGERPYRLADWELVLPELRPLADSADVILSSYLLKSLYYLGRGDLHLSWTETAESGFSSGQPVEFSRDPRTGLPAISTAESLHQVMACFASGLVLVERFHLHRPHLVPEETSELLLARTTEIPLSDASWVLAFVWRHDPADEVEEGDCPPWEAGAPQQPLAGEMNRDAPRTSMVPARDPSAIHSLP